MTSIFSTARDTAQPVTVETGVPAPSRSYLWTGVAAMFVRDILKQLRTPATLFTQFLQIVFFIVLYGVGFSGMVGGVSRASFLAFVYPGLVTIQVATVSLMAGLSLAWDREFGFSRAMLVSPAPRISIPLGKVCSTAVLAVTQGTLMILASPLLGVPLTLRGAVQALAAVALAAAVFCLLGMFLAVRTTSIELAQNVAQLAMFPMLFLSGAVFDPHTVPEWLRIVLLANPMSYAVSLVRHSLIADVGVPLVPMTASLVVLVAVGSTLGAVVTRALRRSI